MGTMHQHASRLCSRSRSFGPCLLLALFGLFSGCELAPEPQSRRVADPAAPDGPLAADSVLWDLGEVQQGKSYEHTFQLTNKGTVQLDIQNVGTDCGCTTTTPINGPVAAGKSVALPVALNVSGVPGPMQQRIDVLYSAEGKTHQLALLCAGQIRRNANIFSPTPDLDFGSVACGESRTQSIKVARHDGHPLEDLRFESASPALTMLPANLSQDARGYVDVAFCLDASAMEPGQKTLTATLLSGESSLKLVVRALVATKPTGLVDRIFIDSLPLGTSQLVPLEAKTADKAPGSPSPVKGVRCQGATRVAVELAEGENDRQLLRVTSIDDTESTELVTATVIAAREDGTEVQIPLAVLVTANPSKGQ